MPIRDIIPSRPADFADVQQQVRDRYIQAHTSDLVTAKAKQAMDLLNSNGGDMEAAAKATGGTVKTSEDFGISGAITGIGSAGLFNQAFRRPVGSVFGPVSNGSGLMVVAKLIQRTPPDMKGFDAQRAQIIDQIKGTRMQQAYDLFQDSIFTRLIAEGKIRVHKDAMDRLMAHYRS